MSGIRVTQGASLSNNQLKSMTKGTFEGPTSHTNPPKVVTVIEGWLSKLCNHKAAVGTDRYNNVKRHMRCCNVCYEAYKLMSFACGEYICLTRP